MSQTELHLGPSPVTKPLIMHGPKEIIGCTHIKHACRISLRHSELLQETVADRIGVSHSYLSLLMSGKRKWSEDKLRAFCGVTGSLAPLQWFAMQMGVDIYVDPIKVRLAQIEAERAELLAREAA